MRFQQVFRRSKTVTTNPALGGDHAPDNTTGRPGNGAATSSNGNLNNWDNVLNAPFANSSGWPVQRIAVAVRFDPTTTGTATLTANGYIYEELTGTWHLMNSSPITLTANQLAFFDVPAIPPAIQTSQSGQMGAPSAGSIAFMLVLTDTGGATASGNVTVAMAPDTTSNPL